METPEGKSQKKKKAYISQLACCQCYLLLSVVVVLRVQSEMLNKRHLAVKVCLKKLFMS